MRPDDYTEFDATGLAELVQRGEVSPQALADAAIKRIDPRHSVQTCKPLSPECRFSPRI
jgi:Asp-tRNA(Asn)/Glu-tRNA(Gln) amidotransferase A subunit family amidase